MGSNWLRGPREAVEPDGLTQEALAAALNVNVKTIQRLERCGSDTPQQVRYEDLAKEVGVCPIQLTENHARDLDANGQSPHAQRARDAADRLRRAKYFPTIDPAPIRRALAACDATGLVERIAERESGLPDALTQAAHIARLLDEGRLADFNNLVDIPLDETIARAATADHLDTLGLFLRTIILACAAADDGLAPGRWHQHHGESKAWPFRALIDRARRLDGMRLVRAVPDTAEARLDDSQGSTRAVRSGNVTQLSVDARLHQLVCAFADTLGTVDQDRPALTDSRAFEDFRQRVNRELSRHNSRHSHVFGLWEQCACEAEDVKNGLLRLLPNLVLFDCGDPRRASTVLRADSEMLETWYAAHLQAVDGRRRILATTPEQATQSTQSIPRPESTTMTESQGAPVQFNVNIHSGNGPANMAAGPAQAHQHNLTTPQAELLPLLERLLAETGTGESRYADLRKACRSAQGEVEENQPISEATKSLFQRAIGALPAADKVVELATKATDLLGKIPGLVA
ncbi:hypothetical protein ThidrDRAFT_3241 [Thiorhodococcus drewsii AZ1]|uniref:HTH cro/C1-type domain-containing protein n=1 Tax=Thiorhodococcus drewsii AZ1 TaxID=765913 RepID=G2E4M8_9GAMM|nr:helix-turn-helix transcriptional regulator [Thiorhodococcus drewsii]EGV29504.1 hypothetical protein ThidrDRAFT_3241 [Thiorhodococcus drewsii AZ1]